MPLYDFRDKITGVIFEKQLKISEVDQYLVNNPQLEKIITSPPVLGDSIRLGIRKNDSGWKEVLHKIAEKTPGGKVLKDNIR